MDCAGEYARQKDHCVKSGRSCESNTMRKKTNFFRPLVILFLCCFIKTWCAPFPNRIVLQGFQNAEVGYEGVIKSFDIKILGAVEGAAGNYLSLRSDLQLGKVFSYGTDVEFIPALGTVMQYSYIYQNGSQGDEAYSVIPCVNLSMNKFFNHVLIGGCISLELWNIQKIRNGSFASHWYGIREFNLNPQFILGYCF